MLAYNKFKTGGVLKRQKPIDFSDLRDIVDIKKSLTPKKTTLEIVEETEKRWDEEDDRRRRRKAREHRGGKKKKIRKHKGIDQRTGKLKKGYKYTDKLLKGGFYQIIKK